MFKLSIGQDACPACIMFHACISSQFPFCRRVERLTSTASLSPMQQQQTGGFACLFRFLQSEYAIVDSTMFLSTDDKDNKKMTIASKVYKLVMRNTPLWPTAVWVCQTVPFVGYFVPAVVLGLVSIGEGLVQVSLQSSA